MKLFHTRIKISSDLELIHNYQETDNLDILGELYLRYMDLVFGVCLKYLKNKADAQDAVIQIFEKLTITLKDAQIENFKPWLYVVSKNYCLMELRKIKHYTISIDDQKSYVDSFMENQYDLHPIDEEQNKINEEALKSCINNLKQQQKESIELFYFKEMTYQEISNKMEVDIKKVKSYIQNAKRNLKICLERNNAL